MKIPAARLAQPLQIKSDTVSTVLHIETRFITPPARIQSAISGHLKGHSACHVMLTGGRSAGQLYSAWAASPEYPANLNGVRFYFGDERCVSPDHPESNHGMAMRSLFPDGKPEGVQIHRMEADSANVEAAADRYAALLPEVIDVLLLSLGEDGHIASLFPHSAALRETRRRVVPVTGPKSPFQRLSITPPVIQSARQVFVMALGGQKRAVYEEALRDPMDINTIPARLVLNRTWIFGD